MVKTTLCITRLPTLNRGHKPVFDQHRFTIRIRNSKRMVYEITQSQSIQSDVFAKKRSVNLERFDGMNRELRGMFLCQ